MTVEYMHICDYAFPAHGGKPCVIGIFDCIWAPDYPMRQPVMCIAIHLRGRPHETAAVRIEFGRPNGDTLGSSEAQVNVGAEGIAFINMNMVNQEFPEPGRYTVRVLSDGRVLASRSIRAECHRHQSLDAPIRH